jgi:N-acetylglucosaminyl-diphospho-decaprenol L-rhamnosyltransferase
MTGAGHGSQEPADLAIIIVSTNEANWLDPCLSTVFEHAGDARLDVVVVDNGSTDGTRELVETRFPEARVVASENRGFAHANNQGAMTCSARYVLFLNPDTEVVAGTFGELVAAMDARPDTGLAGVRQVTADGTLTPTIRYFPGVARAFGEALASERWPGRPRWAGERELDPALHDREIECDWTSGSFMLARREALLSAGLLDERFFIYSEEPDLCLRMKRHGWTIRHLPSMTVIHHAGKGGVRPKMLAQDAYTRQQYARKHFSAPRRAAYLTMVALRHGVRAAVPSGGEAGANRRSAARLALRTLSGRAEPPFGQPPPTALPPG